MQRLVENVMKWHEDKGISDLIGQIKYLQFEFTEFVEAHHKKKDKKEIIDGLGDTIVVLIGIYRLKGYKWEDDEVNYSISKNNIDLLIGRFNHYQARLLLDAVEQQEFNNLFEHRVIKSVLYNIIDLLGYTPEQCLEHAYNEIKNRTGKMVNGVFVKDDK